jgi:hypothetical protein
MQTCNNKNDTRKLPNPPWLGLISKKRIELDESRDSKEKARHFALTISNHDKISAPMLASCVSLSALFACQQNTRGASVRVMQTIYIRLYGPRYTFHLWIAVVWIAIPVRIAVTDRVAVRIAICFKPMTTSFLDRAGYASYLWVTVIWIAVPVGITVSDRITVRIAVGTVF